jgi:hydroxymethylbilane synthase
MRPDLNIVPFRGNVTTRLAKLDKGDVDATILATAGLKRLAMEDRATEIFDTDYFIPAVGQGILAIECREDNKAIRDMLEVINHAPTYTAALAERSMLAVLDGSCRTPIGGYARFENGMLRIDAIVASKDGTKHVRATKTGDAGEAVDLGKAIAAELLENGGSECLKL